MSPGQEKLDLKSKHERIQIQIQLQIQIQIQLPEVLTMKAEIE